MFLEFQKFQGAGNDFVVLDNRDGAYSAISREDISRLTDRKFGIGADGLILMNTAISNDFEMDFYNPDGSKSFCGNGARCAISYAKHNGFNMIHQRFMAIDGLHDYRFEDDLIAVKMQDVEAIYHISETSGYVHTGSPHYVMFDSDLSSENVLQLGRQIRYSEKYAEEGINVNLIIPHGNHTLDIATYERGVENETLSCGTGATACALYYADLQSFNIENVNVRTKGGELKIYFKRSPQKGFTDVWLRGPAKWVFSGNIEL